MKSNGDDSAAKIDLKDLAERCRVASNAVEMLPADARLFAECAEVFDSMRTLIESLPVMMKRNHDTICEGVALAIDGFALDFEAKRRPLDTPQGALRTFAASLRDSLQPPKPVKSPLIL